MVGASRRQPARVATLAALLVALAITGAVTWTVRLAVQDQEHRLLKERTAELGLVFNSAVAAITPTLSEQGTVLRVTHGSVPAFQQVADTAVKTTTGAPTFAWLRPDPSGSGFVVVAASGTGLHPGDRITDERVQTLQAALSTPNRVPTRVIGRSRLLGFALGPPSAPSGTVLYRESRLGPVAPPRQAGTSPFSELDVTLYATPNVDPNQVLVSTTKQIPLRGQTRQLPIPVGTTKWLMSVRARTPLVGGLTGDAQWFALAVGVLGSLLVATVVEVSAR